MRRSSAIKLIVHVLDQETNRGRLHGVELVLGEPAPQMGRSGLDYHAELGEHAADAIQERGAILDPAEAQAVPGEPLLLHLGLDWNEAHARRAQRGHDRRRIGAAVLDRLALAIGTHKLGCHQAGLEPQRLHRSSPSVGPTTGFHAQHRALRQRRQPRQETRAIKLSHLDHATYRVGHAGHEYVLC